MLIAMLANEIIKAIKVITSMLGNRELNFYAWKQRIKLFIGSTWLFKMLHVE